MELLFTGVLKGADFLKASDSEQELIDILDPSPLSVAHDIQPRLLLKTNGKQDHVIVTVSTIFPLQTTDNIGFNQCLIYNILLDVPLIDQSLCSSLLSECNQFR